MWELVVPPPVNDPPHIPNANYTWGQKAAAAAGRGQFTELPATERQLLGLSSWRKREGAASNGVGQPSHLFQTGKWELADAAGGRAGP